MTPPYTVKHAGDTALVIEFGDTVSRDINETVVHVAAWLKVQNIAGMLDVVPTFRSIMVLYEPLVMSVDEFALHMAHAFQAPRHGLKSSKLWRVPICYDEDFALDLSDLLRLTGLTTRQLIEAHSEAEQYVYMIGFLPGQPYVGDLPKCFDLPRLKAPRVKVPAGAVGVVGRLSCIYPLETPCGWRIIGAVPQMLPGGDERMQAGDRIRFEPISRREYEKLLRSCKPISGNELEAA